jgi:hypothetical protein
MLRIVPKEPFVTTAHVKPCCSMIFVAPLAEVPTGIHR